MVHNHDFKKFPELTNNQMQIHYFDSPHKQITENFLCKVVNVHDGDTIRVKADFRDFTFPIRFLDVAAPELNEKGGIESQRWLEKRIMEKEVEIIIDPHNRVEKWGRLLGRIFHGGMDVNDEIVNSGFAVTWENRKSGKIENFKRTLENI